MAASKKSVASTVKRPITRKRIRANRRNAKKSTGPKTQAGKRIVSRNALTHGLRSQHFPILPYENTAEYREFEEAMERDCYPRGILQRQVVYQITQISWKLRRIPDVLARINEEVAERSNLLKAEEREFIENHLIGEIADHLHKLICQAAELVNAMTAEVVK